MNTCLLAIVVMNGMLFIQEQETAPNAAEKNSDLQELSWLVGSWHGSEKDSETEEHWIEPKGGMMLGLNRTTREPKASFEFMRLQQTPTGVVFYASPSGQTAVPFTLKELDKQRAVFENLKNDFPHRIYYERKGDILNAAIEGEINGSTRKIEWTWKLKK